jgi:hypothetical protein
LIPPLLRHCKTDVVPIGVVSVDRAAPDRISGSGGFEAVTPPVVRHEQAGFGPTQLDPLRSRARPAKGGYSAAHRDVALGSIAAAVIDQSAHPGKPARYYLLSNNHVLARSNRAEIGDPILQPAFGDGGRAPRDVIAHLSRFIALRFDGETNLVDAALAEVHFFDLDRAVYWIGYPRSPAYKVRVGQLLQKTGRTTYHSTGTVLAVNTTIDVQYAGARARFARQIVTTNLSLAGDSGSLGFDVEARPVGLLFASSEQVSLMNPIGLVESLLGIRVGM